MERRGVCMVAAWRILSTFSSFPASFHMGPVSVEE